MLSQRSRVPRELSRHKRILGPAQSLGRRGTRPLLHTGIGRVSQRLLPTSPWTLSLPRRSFANVVESTPVSSTAATPFVYLDQENRDVVIKNDQESEPLSFPYLWLRDHCQCSACTHPQTRQRQINTFSIDLSISIADLKHNANGIEVEWSRSGHSSFYSWSWLQQNYPFTTFQRTAPPDSHWKHVKPSDGFPTTSYTEVMSPTSTIGLAQWLHQIYTFGFAFTSNTPPNPAATAALIERIAFIRPTHYGGFWDFTSSAHPTDTAYTTLSLPVHNDTTYFTDPAGLQMFHLLSHTDGSGGESTFVDGFAAAQHLYLRNPEAYNILSTVPIVAHASGNASVGSITNTAVSQHGWPVFNHSTPSTMHPSTLRQIRWNNDDRHVRTKWPDKHTMENWYDAARIWDGILRLPEFEIEVQLVPGMPVIFDNWRMLHGRRAFQGERRVCGAYVGMDDFLAKYRLLNPKGGVQEKGGHLGAGSGKSRENHVVV